MQVADVDAVAGPEPGYYHRYHASSFLYLHQALYPFKYRMHMDVEGGLRYLGHTRLCQEIPSRVQAAKRVLRHSLQGYTGTKCLFTLPYPTS